MSGVYKYIKAGAFQFAIPGQEQLVNQALQYDWNTIIDIGAGNFSASRKFADSGRRCSATTNNDAAYGVDDVSFVEKTYSNIDIETFALPPWKKFDAVWLSHVLEHTLNPGLALKRCRNLLHKDGYLFLMVPPFKHNVVGGHVSVGWNLGLLMYFLILSGFDVKNGEFVKYGYNLVAFVKKGKFPKVKLLGDSGDIEKLSAYFPTTINAKQGFDGDVENVGWQWRIPMADLACD